MTRRTKLIAALSAVALLAVTGFLLGPALFPGLDPSEEVSKASDAKIRAQESASNTSVISGCTYSDAGDVRTVFSDGAELFKFHGDHRIEVEAPLERSDRSAITTYADGTVRVEIFASGTMTRQMPTTEPLRTRWFEPDGSPRNAPEPGAYPKLWDKAADFFTAEHPMDEPMLPAPRTLQERERQFGPRTSESYDDEYIYEEYADGTKYRYDKATGEIRIVTRSYLIKVSRDV